MQIISVTLTNFKTHQDQQFIFELGTNAICGENGAGKTSILEAIAWVLFNYQGSYRKEDLIRNGSQSAQARVAFISSRDSRTYEVQRSTSQGYTLFDPQLNERLPYTRTKDEVLPWLRQHLGVAPDTDLAQLFANTVGIPQGTFTADFLLPTEKRKPIFDTILKVEAYRETYRQSSSLRKYAEAQVQRFKDLIAQYEESLQSWEQLQTRQQQLQLQLAQGEQQLVGLETQSQQIAQQRQRLIAQAEQMQNARGQQQTLSGQLTAQQQTQKRIEKSLISAQRAVDICQAQQPAHAQVLSAEQQIARLNELICQRQQISLQQQRCQQRLTQSQANLSRLEAQLEQFAAVEAELTGIAADVAMQTQLEAQQASLQQQAQTFTNLRFQQQSLTAQVESVSQEMQQIGAELSRLETLQPTTQQIPQWEQQQHRVQKQLSRLEAAQQFEHELKALAETGHAQQMKYRQQVATALSAVESWVSRAALGSKALSDQALSDQAIAPIKTALASGEILSQQTLAGIHNILSDLANQTDKEQLKQQRRDLQNQLQRAYGYQAERMGIGSQQAKRAQLNEQQQQLQRHLDSLNQQLTAAPEIAAAIAQTQTQLQQLNNPKGRQILLQKNIQQRSSVQAQYQTLAASRAEMLQQQAAIAQQITAFDQLDAQLQAQQQLKQTHQAGYLLYLQNQQAAQQVLPLSAENEQAIATLTQLQAQKAELDSQLAALTAAFDPEAFAVTDRQYTKINSQADQLRGRLPQQRQRLAELASQIDSLSATAQKRDQAQAELKQRDRLKRFINYARKVYKSAGPRITERYVHNISREADRLFRELLGRANVALTWSADYEITVQEGAHSRRFVNLSGGEQMCAALAVRLALLKVLADIDVAFFDEPTTNMDRARRASLAEAIARIKSFKQLFVISHDDTFEQVTETVITVTREF